MKDTPEEPPPPGAVNDSDLSAIRAHLIPKHMTGAAANGLTLRELLVYMIEANDRRYREIDVEREKAQKRAERDAEIAMGLARDIQRYKDEKANELREQINKERGSYATKLDLKAATEKIEETMKPVLQFVTMQQGRSSGLSSGWSWLVSAVLLGLTIASFVMRR